MKHLGSYIVQIFVHIFALYVGAGVTRAFLIFKHEKRAQTQTFESGYFRWGRGLPHEGVGAKKVGMSLDGEFFLVFWGESCRNFGGIFRTHTIKVQQLASRTSSSSFLLVFEGKPPKKKHFVSLPNPIKSLEPRGPIEVMHNREVKIAARQF